MKISNESIQKPLSFPMNRNKSIAVSGSNKFVRENYPSPRRRMQQIHTLQPARQRKQMAVMPMPKACLQAYSQVMSRWRPVMKQPLKIPMNHDSKFVSEVGT